jgi:hypothetical protein
MTAYGQQFRRAAVQPTEKPPATEALRQINTIGLNWLDELKQRVPVK